ncbi:hypothetical protein PF002_g5790 [Phytophthora fragariae]|uniref:Tyrosine-protein kinase ephrin type A/B receptor-like domain-containing protein n=1 Tax=Phytophthora fragariae TaxID=53985 RepID=A0A6A4A1I7_9STRA|nr:hypothetical protein PF002_g5790 [Phytophthora fragariae]
MWILQLLAVVELTPFISTAAQSLVVSEANCSVADEAQNASVSLTWSLFDGAVNYTRISHSSNALPAASASLSDRLLILGGIEYESAQPVVSSPVLVYDVATNAFLLPQDQILSAVSAAYQSTGATVESVFVSPASRAEHASFVNQDGAVFIFGGRSREFLNDTWRGCVDTSSTNIVWDELVTDAATVAAAPVPRIGHSFTKVFENSSTIGALVFGGLSEDYVELGALHLAFFTKSSSSSSTPACTNRGPKLTWRMLSAGPLTESGAVPTPRAYHVAMTPSKLFTSSKLACLMVHGGKSTLEGTIFNELWRLCPPSVIPSSVPVERMNFTWELLSEIGTTPGARYGASMTFVDEGKLALAGGSYTFPSDFLSDTWELNVNATQWIRLSFTADYSPPRRGHTLTYFSTTTRLFLFGGRDRYAVVQKRIQAAYYGAPFCAVGLKITFCSATSTYVCIACPAGSYLESGSRKCLLCPQGTFSSAGSAECTKCPVGTYSTDVGKDSSSPCAACPSGTFSQAVGAVSSVACNACAAGTFASSSGSVSCSSCAAGTFSNANASTCTVCPRGKWSSAGSGVCTDCAAGTYTPSTGSTACFSCPRGFFSNQGDVTCSACPVNTYSSSIGASATACQPCPSYAFTTSAGQSDPSSLPTSLDFAPGDSLKTFQIPIAQLSPRTGCRFFSLVLQDAPGTSTSAVSSDLDNKLTVYVDDMNGVSGGVTGKTVTSTYVRQGNGTALAAVTLDRVVTTQLTLTPQTTITAANFGVLLRDQPLNLLVVIDFSATWVASFVTLLPVIIAQLQTVYRTVPDGVRLGLLTGTNKPVAVFYPDLVAFFDGVQALAGSNTSVDWNWIANGLLSNATAWPAADRRHLLVVAGDTLIAGGSVTLPPAFITQLRAQSVFAFILYPTQVTVASGSDVVTSVAYGTKPAIPSVLRQAFEQKDSVLPSSLNILSDPAGLVSSAQVTGFSGGSSSLPVILVTMGSFPTPAHAKAVSSLAVTVAVPGTYSTPSFTCGVCPSGYACRNGKKSLCPAGMFSRPLASQCQSCPPGTISRSEGSPTCDLCPLGWTSNYQRNHCIPCPPGEVTLYAGQHPCSSCIATAFPVRNQPEICLA